jgi:hypothetical protein
MLLPKTSRQQATGFFMLSIGACLFLWTWKRALAYCRYQTSAAFFFPVFAIIGLGLIIFPLGEKFQGQQLELSKLPFIWKIILSTAIFAGVLNLLILQNLQSFADLTCYAPILN